MARKMRQKPIKFLIKSPIQQSCKPKLSAHYTQQLNGWMWSLGLICTLNYSVAVSQLARLLLGMKF